jgi:dTDP-glucose pyrophosphorylase
VSSKPALLVMAAGAGSRYGGLKQLDAVGPCDETLLDYSVFDALRAGFGRVVFVIRRNIEAAFRETVGRRYESRVEVTYAFQELDALPAGLVPAPGRTKPWGTGQAVLVAESALAGPFAVANADDFYGAPSFRALSSFLSRPSGPIDYGLVGFELAQTLSEHGPVARGVCTTGPDGFVKHIEEVLGLERQGDAVRSGDGRLFPGAARASLNLWAFTPTVFSALRDLFVAFLRARGSDPKAEFFLPEAVDHLLQAGAAHVRLLETSSPWFGVTYRDDLPRVRERIRERVRQGEYPERLFPE